MAATEEYFDLLPLGLDPATKAVTAPSGASKALHAELAALNNLHRSILTLEVSPQIPPPPIPVNPKRSAQITKLKDGGNDFYRKGKHGEALKMYHLGITMALGRPLWEPQGLVREEVSQLFANRAQAHMALQNWAEGAVDAEASVEAKRAGNAKAWWRRGKCLLEMGRLDEAHEWVGHGLEMEGEEQELLALQQEVVARLEKKSQREEAVIKAGGEKA
ncbi:tetratricopeptide repeat domain containing protein [Apiospora saccharicola]|uniref:Tetratricopeptide repeat domain containing protein n=1 Tax=Apiospora saccharicola TaxID=335842 RepID=A0ABR1TJ05_9PEZI